MNNSEINSKIELATFAGGCFWCTEAMFLRLKGVKSALPGYTGGKRPNPTYQQVCTGATGHAEAIQVEFDPAEIAYDKLLKIFFHTHNPTTLNKQGHDEGTQYRSAVFYHSPEQKKTAENVIAELENEKIYPDKFVTEVAAASEFYVAEDYHKNYYDSNGNQGYCNIVITPKINKLMQDYSADVKDEYK